MEDVQSSAWGAGCVPRPDQSPCLSQGEYATQHQHHNPRNPRRRAQAGTLRLRAVNGCQCDSRGPGSSGTGARAPGATLAPARRCGPGCLTTPTYSGLLVSEGHQEPPCPPHLHYTEFGRLCLPQKDRASDPSGHHEVSLGVKWLKLEGPAKGSW